MRRCAMPGCNGEPSNGFTVCYACQSKAVAAFVRVQAAIQRTQSARVLRFTTSVDDERYRHEGAR